MLESLTEADFVRRMDEKFELQLDLSAVVDLELVDVRAAGSSPPAGLGRPDPFSIVFRGPTEPKLSQGVYRLVNAEMGALELFLVPITPDASGLYYEAVFA